MANFGTPIQARKKNPNPNFWVRIFPVGYGSSTWRGWGQKFRYMPRNQGNQTVWAGCPGILLGYPGIARKVWEKKHCVQILAPTHPPPKKASKFCVFVMQLSQENCRRKGPTKSTLVNPLLLGKRIENHFSQFGGMGVEVWTWSSYFLCGRKIHYSRGLHRAVLPHNEVGTKDCFSSVEFAPQKIFPNIPWRR